MAVEQPTSRPTVSRPGDDPQIRAAQRFVQILLRAGLAGAVVLMAVGLALKLAAHDHVAGAVPLFALTSGSRADAIMALGVLLLAATPALRVLALVALWARERDWKFVGVALVVVVTLGAAIVVGHG